jgi:cytochrome c biogenesis protein CcmG/thiol:disulfide interchange protein DsbE
MMCRSLLAGLLAAVLYQAGCMAGAGGPALSAPAGEGGLVGNPAPDFSVAPVTGAHGELSLKQMHGKVVLVDFWGTFCTPCKSSFPKLQALNAKYAASGLEIVGISEDEAEDKGKIPTFASTFGAKFPIGWDEDRSISQRYQPETMPASFLIDRRGIVRFAHVGYRAGDEVQIEKEIQDLLAR